MIRGVIDDTMEVKFDRPDSSIVADYGNGLTPKQRQGVYHLSEGSEIMLWIVMTAVDVADPGSAKPFVESLRSVARSRARRRIAGRSYRRHPTRSLSAWISSG